MATSYDWHFDAAHPIQGEAPSVFLATTKLQKVRLCPGTIVLLLLTLGQQTARGVRVEWRYAF